MGVAPEEMIEMPYANRDRIIVPAGTKEAVREAKEDLDLTYREFLERAAEHADEFEG